MLLSINTFTVPFSTLINVTDSTYTINVTDSTYTINVTDSTYN